MPEALQASALKCLDEQERERAARFRFDLHRHRYIAAHAAMRGILGQVLGLAASDVLVHDGPTGKPALGSWQASTGLHFNLSHSGDHALVVVSMGREVGVDIEAQDQWSDRAIEVLPQFSPAEQQALAAMTGVTRLQAFYRCWVRKEALLKALGTGLSIGLDRFTVSVGEQAELLASDLPELSTLPWALQTLDQPGKWAAALAVAGEPARLEWRAWAWR